MRERERERNAAYAGSVVMLLQLKFPLLVSKLKLMNSSIFDELLNRVKWFLQLLTRLQFKQVESIDMTHCVSYPFLFKTVFYLRYFL